MKTRLERVKRTLNPHEATALLGVRRNDSSDVGIRNDVMIRLLVYAGLRRSELIALRWSDINFEDLTITVRTRQRRQRACGGHRPIRVGELSGIAVSAAGARRQLHTRLSLNDPRAYSDMGGRHADGGSDGDAGCLTDRKTGGLADLAPHDLRRTQITEGLNTGATVADMQAQAGHVNAAMTLRYAQATVVVQRRHRINFRFA